MRAVQTRVGSWSPEAMKRRSFVIMTIENAAKKRYQQVDPSLSANGHGTPAFLGAARYSRATPNTSRLSSRQCRVDLHAALFHNKTKLGFFFLGHKQQVQRHLTAEVVQLLPNLGRCLHRSTNHQ